SLPPGLPGHDDLSRYVFRATVRVVAAETIPEDVGKPETLLRHEPAVLPARSQHEIHDRSDARGGGHLYRRPQSARDDLGIDLVDVILLAQLAVLRAGDGHVHDDDVLQRLRYGVLEDALERAPIVIQLEVVHEETHLRAVPRIADRLVVHRFAAAPAGFGERAEPTRSVE